MSSMLLCVSVLGCAGGSSDESSEQDVVPADDSTTIDSAAATSTTTTDSTAEPETDWELADSLSGALRQPIAWSGGFAAINFPDGDARNESDGGQPGELWFSTDGLDWEPEQLDPGLSEVYLLAGEGGDLFALTGNIFDNTTPQTLWHRAEGSTWTNLVTDDRLEHIAIGTGRLIAYRQTGFEILGVFDTTTLEQVGFDGVPDEVNPTENTIYQGRAIGLDDGFIASVGWIESVSPDIAAWRLLYSADGSTWIEHPSGDSETLFVPYGQSAAPRTAGLNLLTTDEILGAMSWVTDTGLDLQPTPVPITDRGSGTPRGFFSVTDGTIRHSADGMSWESMDAPPTWSPPPDFERRGFAEGTIIASDDILLAIGVHGMFEGWVGLVEPTTDVWVATS